MKIGERYGMLEVLKLIPGKKYGPRPRALFRCDCGNEKSIDRTTVTRKRGFTRSCGCASVEIMRKTKTVHGGAAFNSSTPEYSSWNSMKNRCFNPAADSYSRYGGRGITVCDEWRNDFSAFLRDMGKRPTSKHSIGRINNDGNYEPSNCRWETWAEQQANRRSNHRVEFEGKSHLVSHLAKELGTECSRLCQLLKKHPIEKIAARLRGKQIEALIKRMAGTEI